MKILIANDYATPTGGAEMMTLQLREGLRQRGHDARLFASSARPLDHRSLADDECLGTTSRLRGLLQTANPSAYWRLRRVLARFRPDVVHVNMFLTQLSPLILPLLRDVPAVYNAVWYRAICPIGTKMLADGIPCRVPAGRACRRPGCLSRFDWPPLMLQMKLWRRWRHVFDRVVAISEAVKRSLEAEGIGPVEVVLHQVPPQPPRPPLSSPPTAVFAGRLVPEKGTDILVRAFAKVAARVPEARLVVAGDGPERKRLGQSIADSGLSSRIDMAGHLAPPELERRFSGAWVQAVPSRWAEPFGLVAAEAMMRGTAVVASGSGGLGEIVRDGQTGFLVPPGDADALADSLVRLLCDRELAERMGQAGRAVALAEHGGAGFVDQFVRIYQGLLENRGGGHGGSDRPL